LVGTWSGDDGSTIEFHEDGSVTIKTPPSSNGIYKLNGLGTYRQDPQSPNSLNITMMNNAQQYRYVYFNSNEVNRVHNGEIEQDGFSRAGQTRQIWYMKL
jgi:hypothetical protein